MLSFEIGGLDLMRAESVKATIKFAGDDLFIGITPSGHALILDTDHVRSSAPTPVELLLVALGSCTAVDVIGILSKKRENVTSYKVEVTGERREDHPRSFKSMKVHHILKGFSISAKAVAQAIKVSESKYCTVAAPFSPN